MRYNGSKKIKNLSGMGQLIMDINPRRCDSEVYINMKIDVTKLVDYINKKKKEDSDITYFHAFMTALAKTIYNRPKLNYFIANRHVYEHPDITFSFAAKVKLEDSSEELMLIVPVKKNDNIDSIKNCIKGKVNKIRNKKSNSNTSSKGANGAMEVISKLPNIIRVPLVGFFKLTDKLGFLPASFQEDNLYYSSMIVSNIGSLHSPAIYHHLSEFGTCSSLTTIGEIKDEIMVIDGQEKIRKVCEFGITLDERIADGYYFIKSVKLFEYILQHPHLLEDNANTVVNIEENK